MTLTPCAKTPLFVSLLVLALAGDGACAQIPPRPAPSATPPATTEQPATITPLGCAAGVAPDLSNTYVGQLSLDKSGDRNRKAAPLMAVLTITGNTFKLTLGSLKAEGTVTADNLCAGGSVTLKFDEVKGKDSKTAGALRTSGLTLNAGVVDLPDDAGGPYPALGRGKTVVLKSVLTFGGEPLHFEAQGCPKAPCSRKRYGDCPECVEP